MYNITNNTQGTLLEIPMSNHVYIYIYIYLPDNCEKIIVRNFIFYGRDNKKMILHKLN